MAHPRTDRKAQRFVDPVEARQIAEHTAMALADIRRATALEELMARYRTWQSYADAMGVVSGVRDHVRGVVREVAITLKARRVVRDPTGDAS